MNNELQKAKQENPQETANQMAEQTFSAFMLPWPRKPTSGKPSHAMPSTKNPFGKAHYIKGGKTQHRGKKRTPVW
jgi:hypothetical protein